MTDSDLAALRARAEAGDKDAVARLVELAGEQGDTDELRRLARLGVGGAAHQLAELTADRAQRILRDPAFGREWLRQKNMMYLGLIGISTVMVQQFLYGGSTSLDMSGKVCVISFAVSIPLLSALIVIGWQESFRGREAASRVVRFSRGLAQAAAFVGVVAAFWHIWWIAGVVMLAAGLAAVGVHSAGFMRVEQTADSHDPENPLVA